MPPSGRNGDQLTFGWMPDFLAIVQWRTKIQTTLLGILSLRVFLYFCQTHRSK